MKGYVVIKNLKGNLEDISSETPEKNIDYTLLVDVALLEKRVKQVETDDEDEDVTFIFQPVGEIRLIRKNYDSPTPELPTYGIEAGHITEEPPTDTDSEA